MNEPEPTPDAASPLPRSAIFVLRLSVLVGAVGESWRVLLDRYESETEFYEYFYFEKGYPEAFVQSLENGLFWGLLAAAGIVGILLPLFSLMFRGNPLRPLKYELDWGLLPLLYAFSWMLIIGCLHMVRGGIYYELSLGEHAVRYAAPLGLLLLLPAKDVTRQWRVELSTILLILAVAATFAVHGWKAYQHYGPFEDLLLGTAMNFFGFEVWDDSFSAWVDAVGPTLTTIGIVDLIISGILLVGIPLVLMARRSLLANTLLKWLSIIAFYMAFWGTITAISRITEMGLTAGWSHAALRAANAGAPLAMGLLFLFLVKQNRERLARKAS